MKKDLRECLWKVLKVSAFWLALVPTILGGVYLSLAGYTVAHWLAPIPVSIGAAEGSPQKTASAADTAGIVELRAEIQTFKSWVLAQFLTILGIVLTILGFLIAMITWAGYTTMKSHVDSMVERTNLQSVYRSDVLEAAGIYTADVDKAIARTKRALDSGILTPNLAVIAKTNLAYYYAYRRDPADAELALRLAKEAVDDGVEALQHKLLLLKMHYGYVQLRFATNPQAVDVAKATLRGVKERGDCPPDMRQEIDGYLA
jgi:hypothetical protein